MCKWQFNVHKNYLNYCSSTADSQNHFMKALIPTNTIAISINFDMFTTITNKTWSSFSPDSIRFDFD